MYDRITLDELMALTTGHSPGRVSILMPTIMAGPQTRQNSIRWKNQLRQAESMTENGDRPASLARGWDVEGDYEFWQYQGKGLAAYYHGDDEKLIRLPLEVEERVVTGDRFYVKPLLGQFFENGPFFLLALSQNSVRLFSGHRFEIEELTVPDLPRSIDDALWADQPQASLQFRTAGQSGRGQGTAMFHGSGDDAADRQNADLKRYFDIIDRALASFLNGERAPLVIASVDYLRPIYRDANSYLNLLEDGISGNPDELTEKELGEKAWEVVEPYYRGRLTEAAERFGNNISAGLAASDLEQILLAAYEGRIDTLWVSRDEVLWGRIDDEGHLEGIHDEQQPGDECLLDAAAAQTLATSGRVFAVEPEDIPGGTKMAAILRY